MENSFSTEKKLPNFRHLEALDFNSRLNEDATGAYFGPKPASDDAVQMLTDEQPVPIRPVGISHNGGRNYPTVSSSISGPCSSIFLKKFANS